MHRSEASVSNRGTAAVDASWQHASEDRNAGWSRGPDAVTSSSWSWDSRGTATGLSLMASSDRCVPLFAGIFAVPAGPGALAPDAVDEHMPLDGPLCDHCGECPACLGSTPKKDEGSGKESAEDVHRHSAEEQKSTLSSVEDGSVSDIMLADLTPHVRKSVESLTALNETVREEMVHPAGVPRYVAEYAVEVLNALKPLTDQIAYLQKLAGSIDTMSDLADEDDPGEAPASKHLREAPGG